MKHVDDGLRPIYKYKSFLLFYFLYLSCFLIYHFIYFMFSILLFFCSILKLEGGHVVKTISHFKGCLKFFKTIHGFERMFIGFIRTLLQDSKDVHGVNIFTRLKKFTHSKNFHKVN
jgi:hypothetical protein